MEQRGLLGGWGVLLYGGVHVLHSALIVFGQKPRCMARTCAGEDDVQGHTGSGARPVGQVSEGPASKFGCHGMRCHAFVLTPPNTTILVPFHPAGQQMLGQHILFKWPTYGWCLGKISACNTNPKRKVSKQTVNFIVFYPDDGSSGPHCLSLDNIM